MSATVTVDREALRNLLFEVDALGDVEALRVGHNDGSLMHHIFLLTDAFRKTIDPREEFEEGQDALAEEEYNAVADVRGLHARHLFRSLVIEDMLSHA